MRVSFWQVFRVRPNGAIEPIRVVKIGGVQLSPGVTFGKGVTFGGVDISQFVGNDLEAEERDGILVVTAIYPTNEVVS